MPVPPHNRRPDRFPAIEVGNTERSDFYRPNAKALLAGWDGDNADGITSERLAPLTIVSNDVAMIGGDVREPEFTLTPLIGMFAMDAEDECVHQSVTRHVQN
jgi:hypothetical protein